MGKKQQDNKSEEAEGKSGSGNYQNDIPIDENVVNYRTNKTAGEEGRKTALKKGEDSEELSMSPK